MHRALVGFNWSSSPEGRMDSMGPRLADWLGVTVEQGLDLNEELIHPPDRARNRERWGWAMRHREPFEGAVRMRRRDGALIWCAVFAVPVYDGVVFRGFTGFTVPVDVAREVRAVCSPKASAVAAAASRAATVRSSAATGGFATDWWLPWEEV